MTTSGARIALGIWTALVLFFLWAPLVLIGIYAFNKSNVQSWPLPGWTTHWFRVAWSDPDVRSSLWLSFKVGQGNVLTLSPPLIIRPEELDHALDLIDAALSAVEAANAG